jgi:hypothetical protein
MVNPLDIINSPVSILARDTLRSRRAAPEGLQPNEEGPPAYTYPPGYDRLVPVGNSDFYVTPNDPVDPWDCEAWPGSPYCDGGPVVDPLESGYPGAYADLGISPDGCEVCLTITPSILWMEGPPYTVCYRFPGPGCRPEGGPPEIEVPDYEGVEQPPLPVARDGYCRHLWAYWAKVDTPWGGAASVSYGGGVGRGGINNPRWQNPNDGMEGVAFSTTENIEVSYFSWECFRPPGTTNPNARHCNYNEITLYAWYDIKAGETDTVGPQLQNSSQPWQFLTSSCAAAPIPAPPYRPEPRGRDDMGCNCAEIEDLLRDIHHRLGCKQFPVEVPQSLYGNSDKTTKLQDVPNLWGYWLRQMDALMGQWPIDIEIEDDDPTQEGRQVKKLELPNIAETLAEIFGLAYKIDTTGDLTTEMMLRLIPEVIATKNSSLTTQDYVKANASYLGYRGNPVTRKVEYAFDVEQVDSLPGLLKTVTKNIQGWQEEDPDTVDSYLKRLMFAAGIIKAAFMMDGDNVRRLLDSVDGIFRDELENDNDWEVFLRRLERETDPFNRNSIPRPNVQNTQTGGETIGDRIADNQNS